MLDASNNLVVVQWHPLKHAVDTHFFLMQIQPKHKTVLICKEAHTRSIPSTVKPLKIDKTKILMIIGPFCNTFDLH